MIHFNEKDQEIFAFGKYKGQVVKKFSKRPGLLWLASECRFPALYKENFHEDSVEVQILKL
jgi:DNA polymerase-3 subunit epsilon